MLTKEQQIGKQPVLSCVDKMDRLGWKGSTGQEGMGL